MPKKVFKVKEAEIPEPIPVGFYPAKLASWEEKEGGEFGDYVRLEFEIVDGEYSGITRSLIASSKLTKGKTQETTSKLFRAITGLLGREPKADEEISLDALVEAECQILVEDRSGDKEGWQDITKVLPAVVGKGQESLV